MCIILYKEAGTELPKEDVLRRCERKNSDGIGLMVKQDGWIRIRKGFMNFEEFWAAYRNEGLTKDSEFAIHFRLATAGGVSKGNCHPFPVSDRVFDLKKVKFKQGDRVTQAVMHNGILGKGNAFLSDTMMWIKDSLFVVKDHLGSAAVMGAIEKNTQGSKLLFFDGGEVRKTGIWYEDKETGIHYSNLGYKEYKFNNNVYYAGGKWVKDEDNIFDTRSNWAGYRRGKQFPSVYTCEVCETSGDNYSVGFYTGVVLCMTCGYKFDQDGGYVGWNNSIWDKYYFGDGKEEAFCAKCGAKEGDYLVEDKNGKWYCLTCDEGLVEDKAKCEVCGATEDTYLVMDDREGKWFCLTCKDYIGEEKEEEEIICDWCGFSEKYLQEEVVIEDGERVTRFYCTTCKKYIDEAEELLCDGCGLDSDYLIDGCCAICNEVKRSQKANAEAQWGLWRIDVCT